MFFKHSLKLVNDKNTPQRFFMEGNATGKIFKTGIYGKWVGTDSAGESSGLTDTGQITQETGWS